MRRLLAPLAVVALALLVFPAFRAPLAAQTDLDEFMRQVLSRRDENWRKLQQYVLDERQTIDLRGPGHAPVWGEQREFTWFVRDGYFVRSPLRVNGAAVSEGERRSYERQYLRSAQERERRFGDAGVPRADDSSVGDLIRQSRQPQFISSAYFLRFRFEDGHYALVGREAVDGRHALRVEYYPAQLFNRPQRWSSHNPSDEERARANAMERMLNKVALVTIWIDPDTHQILKYTFDNVSFEFLPAQWLVHVNSVRASMTMSQAFPDVWLPREMELTVGMTLAVGDFDMRYGHAYSEYRKADVTTTIGIPGER